MLWHHRIAQWQKRGMSRERAGELVGSVERAEKIRVRARVPAWGRSVPIWPDFEEIALAMRGGRLGRDEARVVHRIMRGRWAGRSVKTIVRELNTQRVWDPVWRRWHEELVRDHTEDQVLEFIERFRLPYRTDWLRARIQRLNARGLDPQEIIMRLPVGHRLSRRLVEESGLKQHKNESKSATTLARLEQVQALREHGSSWTEIAQALGISKQALSSWRHRHMSQR